MIISGCDTQEIEYYKDNCLHNLNINDAMLVPIQIERKINSVKYNFAAS